jgi:hypothetical protein
MAKGFLKYTPIEAKSLKFCGRKLRTERNAGIPNYDTEDGFFACSVCCVFERLGTPAHCGDSAGVLSFYICRRCLIANGLVW